MAVVAANIHTGPATIFMGGAAPASSLPPTWQTHTNGVPAGFTHIGATLGDTVFNWKPNYNNIEAEQALGIIDKFVTAEDGTLEFEAEERTQVLLKQAFGNIGTVDDGTRTGFYGGGGGTILNIQYVTLVLTSLRRDLAGKYEVLVLYKAVCTAGIPLTYSRTKVSTYKMNFQALPDGTRTVGDQIFQFSREK